MVGMIMEHIPGCLCGQSVTLIDFRLITFGGEHRSRHLLNDVHVLDLDTMTCVVVEVMKASNLLL